MAGAWASLVGLLVFRLCIGLEHGFLEFGAAIATALAVTKATTGGVRPALVVVLVGYGFAWGAHRWDRLADICRDLIVSREIVLLYDNHWA